MIAKGMMKTISMLLMLTAVQVEVSLGETVPVWRFWSPVLLDHFYTANQTERDLLLHEYSDVWTDEGTAYGAHLAADDANMVPVYRFWSPPLTSHFYTASETEREFVQTDLSDFWTYEGIAFYVYPAGSQPPGTVAVHRSWSDLLGSHFYTADDFESFAVTNYWSSVWTDEGIAWYAEPAQDPAAAQIVSGPYLLWPATDSMTVMWETDIAAPSRVDYGVGSPTEAFVEDPNLVRRHKVELTDLAADTAYRYQVASGPAVSEVSSFATAPATPRPFRLAVYGDSRGDPDTYASVVAAMIESAPEIAIHLGDLVPAGRDYTQYGPEFFTPAAPMLATTPLLPVLGNHEYFGTGPLWYFHFFDLPYEAGWYAMTYGNARLVVLDTDLDFSPGSPQYEWLMSELTSQAYNQAVWHLVFFHHPPFSATVLHTDDRQVQTHLVPVLEAFDVDVAFQGHSHTYERYELNGVYYIVTGGGGSPLYDLVPDLTPPIRQFGRTVYHYCTIDVDPAAETLTVSAVDTTGEVFDTLELRR